MSGFKQYQRSVNGLRLNVIDEGEGEPVLLVHGFPDDHSVWRHQIRALVDAGYRVIAPDMRGCGQSDAPRGVAPYTLDWLVGDLVALLDQLGLRKVRLVGHDWGAVIAWTLAIRHPRRVHNLVALSVGHPSAYARAPMVQKRMGWYILMFQLRGFAEWLIRRSDWRWMRRFSGQHAELAHWIPKLARPGRLSAAVAWYRANLGLVLPHARPKAPVPVLGIWSDGDRYLCEAQMRDSEAWVAGPWRYERVAGATHWLQLDQPERINRLMLQAFERHPMQA